MVPKCFATSLILGMKTINQHSEHFNSYVCITLWIGKPMKTLTEGCNVNYVIRVLDMESQTEQNSEDNCKLQSANITVKLMAKT